MKKIAWMLSPFLLIIFSCTSRHIIEKEVLQDWVTKNQYTFTATRAIPSNYDVINLMNQMPNTASSRILQLDPGYAITFKGQEMEVVLPYFGRSFFTGYDANKNNFRFVSKNFETLKKQHKKGHWILLISPKDVSFINRLSIEVHKNGSVYVSIDAIDRQTISYDGYITSNEAAKN